MNENCMTLEELIEVLFNYIPPWWGDNNPILEAILSGFGSVATFLYCNLVYIKMQTRIKTSTDIFLDLTAQDYFGSMVQRCPGEGDETFRDKILKTLIAPRCTKSAMINALKNLTGRTPIVWEPYFDGGYYNHSFFNHASFGFIAPYQAWIIVFRPEPVITNDTAFLNNTCFATAESYYGSAQQNQGCVTDADILNTIEITKLAGTFMHVTILD